MQCGDCFLDVPHTSAQVPAFQAAGDGHVALQVLAANFRLARNIDDGRERAERPNFSCGADQQRVTNGLHRRARILWKAHANRVRAIVHHDGRGRELSLHDGAGIQFDFLRCEPAARCHRRVHLKHRCRPANGVIDAVEHVHDAGNFLDSSTHARPPFAQNGGILRKQLDGDGLGRAG